MIKAIQLRRLTATDLLLLKEISVRTFVDSFSDQNTAENMEQYLSLSFSDEKLRQELANPHSAFYFAEINTIPIGYLKVNWGNSQTELMVEKSIEIERIYVEREYHGKQVGQCLLDKALHLAKGMNAASAWLGVWEKNPRAIRFYQKNGFIEFDKHIFKLGNDEQTDILMRLVF